MSTRPPDPRGADRRSPSEFGEQIGYDIPNDAPPVKRRRWQFPELPRQPLPDCGCHMYERSNGVTYTRCPAHRPAGSRDLGPCRGECVCCVAGKV